MTGWTEFLMPHLMLAPIMLPMFTAALMLFMGEERQRLKLGMNILSTTVGLLLVIMLLGWTNQSGATATMAVYLPGNWQAPFGIALALDRLSALMLLVIYVVALAALVLGVVAYLGTGKAFMPTMDEGDILLQLPGAVQSKSYIVMEEIKETLAIDVTEEGG